MSVVTAPPSIVLVPPRRHRARAVTLVVAGLLMVVTVGLQSFERGPGVSGTMDRSVGAAASAAELRAAVARQESVGLTCAAEPVLTDVVLAQETKTQSVRPVSFGEAIRLAGSGRATIRAYCV